jgi:hypothetical protein
MSSLIFATDEQQIVVATDTLAVTTEGEPFLFASKATHIPHLKTIIAGTGAGGLSNEWALTVSTRMIVRGIMNLDFHTPEGLRELWKKYKTEYPVPDRLTTTVYQFGLSEEDGRVVSFAYRSANNFVSEQLQYGFGVKPECIIPEGDFIEALPNMMAEQRKNQESLPKDERVYIGGEIQVLYLTADGCRSFKAGQFPDFEDQERAVFESHENEKR